MASVDSSMLLSTSTKGTPGCLPRVPRGHTAMPCPKPFQQPLSEPFLPSSVSHPLSDLGSSTAKGSEKATALSVTLLDMCLGQKWPEKHHSSGDVCYVNFGGGAGGKPEMVLMHVPSLSLHPGTNNCLLLELDLNSPSLEPPQRLHSFTQQTPAGS